MPKIRQTSEHSGRKRIALNRIARLDWGFLVSFVPLSRARSSFLQKTWLSTENECIRYPPCSDLAGNQRYVQSFSDCVLIIAHHSFKCVLPY